MYYINISSEVKPHIGRPVIAYCPKWCESGYQVCRWDGSKFFYDEQPNDSFGDFVESWAAFMEAD